MDNKTTAQPPAEGVYIGYQTHDCITLSVPCRCTDPDDQLELSVDVDTDGVITVHQSVLAKTDFWTRRLPRPLESGNRVYDIINGFITDTYNSLRRKLSITYDVWVHGHAKYHQYTVLSEQQALNYAKALEHAVSKLKGNQPAPVRKRRPRRHNNKPAN